MIVDEELFTRQQSEAESWLRQIFRSSRIYESVDPFEFRLAIRGDDAGRVARFHIGSYTEISVDVDGMIGIGRLTGGAYRALSNGEELDATKPFLMRPGQTVSRSLDIDATLAYLDLVALQRFAERGGYTRGPLRFRGVGARAEAFAAHWTTTVTYAEAVLCDPELLRNDLLRKAAVEALFAAALVDFRTDRDPLDAAPEGSLPNAVRRAIRFIEEHAAEPIGLVDIAEASRMSCRGLQAAFRRTTGRTPTAILREVRVERAHEELLRADPSRVTVAGVARRWGFAHTGRFASTYRARYGELPSTTLNS